MRAADRAPASDARPASEPGAVLGTRREPVEMRGNPDMIDECSGMLEAGGFKKTELVREKYLPAPAPR